MDRRSSGIRSLFAVALLAASASWAGAREFSIEDAVSAPIEDLMTMQVTTVAGAERDWFRSPAALYVITNDQLRRSGHHTLADVLRMAPGVYVGSVNAHSWTVGARGFAGGLANKTLVLIDGRAVYDPLFGGTFWDVQNIMLCDLERIEVIRGPGATLWGANAVNGVINVITRSSADTQGAHVGGGGGSEEHGFVSARYGGTFPGGNYRVFGKYFDRDHYTAQDGSSARDAWDLGHGGFRFDSAGTGATRYTVQGDVYNLNIGESQRLPVAGQHLQFTQKVGTGWANGGNVLVRATHSFSPTSGLSVQAYYDRTARTQNAGFHVERDTADFDLRHHFRLGERQEIQWGVGDRYSSDRTRDNVLLQFDPQSRQYNTVSGFVQDTITIVPDRVFAMLGTKLEYNSYTGFEVQPGGRLWWTPDDRNTLWASISRPVRVPSRIEQDAFLTIGVADSGLISGGAASGIFFPIGVEGNPDTDSEKMLAYELGYRRRLTANLTLDIAPFYNEYSNLLSVPSSIFGRWSNAGSGEGYGVEVSSMWRALEWWRLEGSYSYVKLQIHGDVFRSDEGNTPHHQVKLFSHVDLGDVLELNTGLYYVDEVPTPDVPAYVRLDQGVTWHATRNVDLTLWGQNLLEDTHREATSIRVDRAIYLEAALRF